MKIKKLLILILFLIILSPTIASLSGVGNVASIDENRYRTAFPSAQELRQEFLETKNVYPSIERWYNDSFGLRDLLIRAQHQLDYNLFSYNPDLYFIKDGYLVYRNVVATDQISNEEMTPEQTEQLIQAWERTGDILNARGISFRFFYAPQKNEILLEESRQIPIARPDPNALHRLEERILKSSAGKNYVSVLDALKRQNSVCPVFYYSDFHWNDWGAAVGFAEIFHSYGKEKGLGTLYSLDDLTERVMESYQGGQLNNLSVLRSKSYTEYTVDKENAETITPEDSQDGKLVHWDNNENYQIDGAVLFVGDSYTLPAVYDLNGTKCGFVNIFSDTYFCHWDNSEGLLNRLPENVKFIIFEKTESGISYSLEAIKNLGDGS